MRTLLSWLDRTLALSLTPWPFWPRLLGAPTGGRSRGRDTGREEDEEREEVRQSLWRLRRALSELSSRSFEEELAPLLHEIFGPGGLERSLVAWVELIEALVQSAEQRYGRTSGLGPAKARDVKASVLYLARRLDLDVPRVPGFLEPLLLDAFLDVLIAAVVELLNRHDIWQPAPAAPRLPGRLRGAVTAAPTLLGRLGAWLTRLSWWLVARLNPVSPQAKESIDRVLARHPQEILFPVARLARLARWLVVHGRDLVGLVEVVSTAVLEAETLLRSDGRRKKLYARELVLSFLDEILGLPPRDSLAFQLVDWAVDFGIESVVRLFNKRNVLPSASQPLLV